MFRIHALGRAPHRRLGRSGLYKRKQESDSEDEWHLVSVRDSTFTPPGDGAETSKARGEKS